MSHRSTARKEMTGTSRYGLYRRLLSALALATTLERSTYPDLSPERVSLDMTHRGPRRWVVLSHQWNWLDHAVWMHRPSCLGSHGRMFFGGSGTEPSNRRGSEV